MTRFKVLPDTHSQVFSQGQLIDNMKSSAKISKIDSTSEDGSGLERSTSDPVICSMKVAWNAWQHAENSIFIFWYWVPMASRVHPHPPDVIPVAPCGPTPEQMGLFRQFGSIA